MAERGGEKRFIRTRREFLGDLGTIFVAGAFTFNGVAREIDLMNRDSHIRFVDAKEKKPNSKKGVLVFGGMTVENAQPIANAIASDFKDPVMFTDYSRETLNVPSLVDDYLKIKEETGMEELTLYCHSEGMQVAGEFAKLLREKEIKSKQKRTKLPRIILDCPTVNFDDTYFPILGKIPPDNPLLEFFGADIAALVYWKYYGHPIQPGTASIDLLEAQMATLDDGIRYTAMLAGAAHENESKVYALWPENPAADNEVKDIQSRAHVGRFFPRMQNIYVGGTHQGHANPDHNKDGYKAAIKKINALSGGDW